MKKRKKYIKNKPPKHKCEKYTEGLRQKMTDQEVCLEAVFPDTLMTIIGHNEIWVENYKALLEYKECQVLLQAGHYVVCIAGEGLIISHYMEEHMMICGNIRSITYL